MNTTDKLVKKYWKGSSELDEEQKLKTHFSENEMPQVEGEYFSYLENKRKEKLNAPDFDAEILRQIKGKQISPIRSLFQKINWQVAAAILLLFSAGVIMLKNHVANRNTTASTNFIAVDTFDDPQLAYEETKKALLLISSKLNKGKSYTAEFVKFSESQENLKKENKN